MERACAPDGPGGCLIGGAYFREPNVAGWEEHRFVRTGLQIAKISTCESRDARAQEGASNKPRQAKDPLDSLWQDLCLWIDSALETATAHTFIAMLWPAPIAFGRQKVVVLSFAIGERADTTRASAPPLLFSKQRPPRMAISGSNRPRREARAAKQQVECMRPGLRPGFEGLNNRERDHLGQK